MAKVKTALELLKLTGLGKARYTKSLNKDIEKIKKQLEKNPTKTRQEKLKKLQEALNKVKGTGRKGKKLTAAQEDKLKATEAQEKRLQNVRKAEKNLTGPEQRSLIAQRKREIKRELDPEGPETTRILTPKGEKLFRQNTPESLGKILKNFNKYSYLGGRQNLVPKTGRRQEGEPMPERMGERIEELLGQRPPSFTRRQAAEEMGLGSKGELPTEEELKALDRFQIFKKGGLKKYQKEVNYKGKKYVYTGTGTVSDIPNFFKKKGKR